MRSEKKTELIKARVTRSMKAAVERLAASYPQGREAEALIIREALAEYLQRRGYLTRPAPPAAPPHGAEESNAAPPKKVMVLKTFKPPAEHPPKSAGRASHPPK